MINELVVHLGDTKTGSTSIQRVLVRETYDIGAATLCYPTKNHHIAMAKTLTRKHRMAQRSQRFQRLFRDLSQSDADYGIISAEHFQFVDPEVFAGAIAEFWPGLEDRMRLVAYARPHADKLLSSFSERVKLGAARGSFEAFLDQIDQSGSLDYAKRFGKWRKVFGERFQLRPFVRPELYRQDAVADFFRFVLGHDGFQLTGNTAENTSMTVQQLALLREVHTVFDARLTDRKRKRTPKLIEARSALGRTTSERIRESGLGSDSPKFRIPARLADRIHARYREDAEALDKAFFTGTPMADALDDIQSKTTRERQNLKAGAHFSPDVVTSFRIFGSILSDMALDRPEKFKTLAGKSRIMLARK